MLQFTNGRTDSLCEMSLHEYNEAIRAMEKLTRAEETEAMRILKSKRSAVLHQMQLSGVDTADWKKGRCLLPRQTDRRQTVCPARP